MAIKILQVVPSISNSGGIEKYVYDLSLNKQEDIFISICTYHANNSMSMTNSLENSNIDIYSLKSTFNERIQSKYLSLIYRNLFFPYLIKYLDLKKIIKINNPDIILFHGEDSELIGAFIKFPCKINVVHGESFFPVNPLYKYILRSKRVSSFSHSFFVSKELVNSSSNYSVIKTGINISEFSLCNRHKFNNKKEIVFGYLGRLSKEKGIENLVLAFKEFYKTNKYCKLKIGGNGTLLTKLQKEASYFRDKNIYILGEINNKVDFFNQIDVLFIPSFTEGFPYVMLEAMAANVLVIANNVGGIKSLITNYENGILMDNNTPEKIKNAMQFVLNNSENMNDIIIHANKCVQNYSLESFAEQFYSSIRRFKENRCVNASQ